MDAEATLSVEWCYVFVQVTKDKDGAVRGQDFEKAGQLRDREMELKAKISAIIAGAKEQGKAEAESVEGGGPQVRWQEGWRVGWVAAVNEIGGSMRQQAHTCATVCCCCNGSLVMGH
jgi:hypothetical protein